MNSTLKPKIVFVFLFFCFFIPGKTSWENNCLGFHETPPVESEQSKKFRMVIVEFISWNFSNFEVELNCEL